MATSTSAEMPGLASSRAIARLAGRLYLLNIATILVATFLFRGIVVAADPAASAANLLAHEATFRAAIAFEVLSTACSVTVAALLYEVLKSVSRNLSLTAAFFRLLACGVAIVGYGFQVAPLQILAGSHQLSGLTSVELQSLALLVYRLHGPAADMVIVFFGFHFVLLAALILRSTLLPRALGMLAGLAGVGGLTFLVPSLARPRFPYIVAVGFVTELSLALWLAVKGVRTYAP